MIGLLFMLVYLAVVIGTIVGAWKTFEKAGKPGWACLVPIYNMMVMAEIGGRPATYGLFCLIPIAGIYFAFVILIDFAKAFGQSAAFGVGLGLLAFVFFPMLGFGDARYVGPTGAKTGFAPVMPAPATVQ